jgi:pyruvate,water dikinase
MSGHNPELDGDADGELCAGHGASPGTGVGPVRIVHDRDEIEGVGDDEIIVTGMTSPEMVPAMKRAAAIVTDEGGITSHAAIVSRELGVPAVVGTGDATRALTDGQVVAVDGERGTVRAADEPAGDGEPAPAPGADGSSAGTGEAVEPAGSADDGGDGDDSPPATSTPSGTATGVKVNVSIPEAAERAADTGADGVGLLRLEHILLSMGKTPQRYVADHGEEAFVERVADELETVADAFYPRPVRARTLDAPTDELAELEGGEDEPHEHNPMLGWRGVRRSLDEPELARLELRAFGRLHERGYDNVEVLFPLPNDPEEVVAARELMAEADIDPEQRRWGVMIETPASVRQIDEIIDTGIDFVALGTNDLVQYILAVDRNNGQVADLFDEMHPSVLEAMGEVIEACNEAGVDTTITGQAGSRPDMARFLVRKGISSVSANIDAVEEVREVIDTAERQMTLEASRLILDEY